MVYILETNDTITILSFKSRDEMMRDFYRTLYVAYVPNLIFSI